MKSIRYRVSHYDDYSGHISVPARVNLACITRAEIDSTQLDQGLQRVSDRTIQIQGFISILKSL